ncbi:MAG TPA: hypothetical protein VFA70_02440, partial [Dehalococcoidia bacterium]|nr:hypothetical protein [Dehalococcoidia bacterium]
LSAYWFNWDIARAMVLTPDGTGGYVLDGWGGVHPFAIGTNPMPPNVNLTGYWFNWDIARSLTIDADGKGGYVLDGWGGLHPFGTTGHIPPAATITGYTYGADTMRQVQRVPGLDSEGWVIDAYGHIYPWGSAGIGMAPTFGTSWTTTTPFTRGFAIRTTDQVPPLT